MIKMTLKRRIGFMMCGFFLSCYKFSSRGYNYFLGWALPKYSNNKVINFNRKVK